MKYSVITFGCRVNQADSLAFERALVANGAQSVTPEQADVVIVNTCSVTASADQGARQTIRRLARQNPGARIVVTGCYATRRPDELRELPGVSNVVVNDDKPRLVPFIRSNLLETDQSVLSTAERFGEGDGACGAELAPGVAGRTAFTLRVQTGCAERCSYCIIPTTRGAPRSVPLRDVVLEVRRVAEAGFKEIALTGVHLGSYGRDLTPRRSLVELLEALAVQPAVQFRISSLEPMDCTPAIVKLVAERDCFAPHFHLPLQHASDRMLNAMRRPYSAQQYAALVDDIARRIPNAAIGTDVIVGFPGESDADFEELSSYLERSPLTHVHVFPYSDRPGTDASTLPNRVAGTVVRERARLVREISARLSRRFHTAQIGSIQRGLTLEDGALVVTGNYLKLRIPAGLERNAWVRVIVTSEHHGELLGG
jgi:threonylcarbamoyladenosine tRNA methylthiotransferase MtaB